MKFVIDLKETDDLIGEYDVGSAVIDLNEEGVLFEDALKCFLKACILEGYSVDVVKFMEMYHQHYSKIDSTVVENYKEFNEYQGDEDCGYSVEERWLPNPGYMPVDEDTLVDTVLKKGGLYKNCRAADWDWEEEGEYRIEKYRVIKKEEE